MINDSIVDNTLINKVSYIQLVDVCNQNSYVRCLDHVYKRV